MNEMSMNAANALASAFTNNGTPLSLNTFGSDHLHKVRGVEGMNTFQTKPSSEYALFEEDSNIFCFKTTDAQNHATDRYFRFQEITKEEAIQDLSPYLMKGELDSFKENVLSAIRTELNSFREEIINAQQSVRSGNKANNNQQRPKSIESDQS